jgi:hypothetical protein
LFKPERVRVHTVFNHLHALPTWWRAIGSPSSRRSMVVHLDLKPNGVAGYTALYQHLAAIPRLITAGEPTEPFTRAAFIYRSMCKLGAGKDTDLLILL